VAGFFSIREADSGYSIRKDRLQSLEADCAPRDLRTLMPSRAADPWKYAGGLYGIFEARCPSAADSPSSWLADEPKWNKGTFQIGEAGLDVQILDTLLAAGVKGGASDLHFKVGDKPVFRIDGDLVSVKYDRLTAVDTTAISKHLLGDDPTAQKLDQIQEYDASYSLKDVARFRVNIYRQRGTLCCILRVKRSAGRGFLGVCRAAARRWIDD
jgi:hypothetical protein